MQKSKAERFRIFLERLRDAEPAGSDGEALNLIARTLDAVEDEFSGVPADPDRWREDGRMYPPQPDSERAVGKDGRRRFRSRGHETLVGHDGSIEIRDLDSGRCEISKPGRGLAEERAHGNSGPG